MHDLKDSNDQTISPIQEAFSEPIHFCRRIVLVNGVTLLYDDRRGLAEGSDGKTYYAVCKQLPGVDESVELLGWSAEITQEVVLR